MKGLWNPHNCFRNFLPWHSSGVVYVSSLSINKHGKGYYKMLPMIEANDLSAGGDRLLSVSSLQCRRFLWARNLLAKAPCWNFPKRGGNGASQRERGGGGEREESIFFLPSPSPLSFFRPRTYRKGYNYYSPQSSTVIKSKMAATTTLRTRTRFRPPKIRLQCRLLLLWSKKEYGLLKSNLWRLGLRGFFK